MRRDTPDWTVGKDGKPKQDRKYLGPPRSGATGVRNRAAGLQPPVQPCTFVNGLSGASGEATMATLASMLRGPAGRVVVNRTGLTGSFRVSLTFEPVAIPGLSTTAPSGDPPSVFTAVREQLGLRLDPSRIERDVLVIDHIERPTEN